jgi:hypothetical protein
MLLILTLLLKKEEAGSRPLPIDRRHASPTRKLCCEDSTMDHMPGSVSDAVNDVLQASGRPVSRPAEGEWGMVLDDVGGWPLDVGLRVRDGLLAIQAQACRPDRLDAHLLLHRNRLGDLVRYAHAADGTVHVHAEIPLSAAADAATVDRVLGLVIEAAGWAREAAGRRRRME